ncbi:hypothetical protein BGZ68_006770 [Mortierella alpina]|nr:hypothetical protein BGZ68_006770 [Mortierella alpina]
MSTSCLALPELTKLTFHRDIAMFWDDEDETTVVRKLEGIINKATTSRFSHPGAKRIKTLQLPCNPTGIRNPLPLLLLKSKLLDLETCEPPWFRRDARTREIQDVVRNHCPNLKHLHFPQNYDEDQDGQAARAFIRGCSGLKSFTSAYFMDSIGPGPRMILSELLKHHYTTLENFELTDPQQVNSHDLHNVLSQCKQLKRFWVANYEEEDSMCGIVVEDISRSDWVCTELIELSLALNRCPSDGDLFGDLEEDEAEGDPYEWLTASTTKRAFQQIGRLNKLEVLRIDIDRSSRTKAKEKDYAWDLTLWSGWLSELAGLRNLRILGLKADFWSCMKQEEVNSCMSTGHR